MPLIQLSQSIPAASIVDNLVTGSQFEFLPFDASLEFGINGDAGGADLRIDAYSGQDTLAENMTANSANRMPIFPDDYVLTDVAAAGERIKVRIRNTNATLARTVFFALRITAI